MIQPETENVLHVIMFQSFSLNNSYQAQKSTEQSIPEFMETSYGSPTRQRGIAGAKFFISQSLKSDFGNDNSLLWLYQTWATIVDYGSVSYKLPCGLKDREVNRDAIISLWIVGLLDLYLRWGDS